MMQMNTIQVRIIVLTVTFLCVSSSLIFATNYYVNAATGNDANSGRSLALPFLTVQKALDKAVNPGDIILVEPGVYKQNLIWKHSGTIVSKITLKKRGTGIVYLKSADNIANPVLQITNCSNLIIDGCTFTRDNAKNNAQGLLINSFGLAAMQNIEVKNCVFTGINWSTNPNVKPTVSQNAQPFIVYGRSSMAITNINVHNCVFNNNITGQSEVCSINSNVDGFIITKNIFHDNTNIAIDAIGYERENVDITKDQAKNGIISLNTLYNNQSPYAEGASIYVDGGRSLIIERNKIYNGDYGIEISAENDPASVAFETQDITVRNNLIYNCRSAALKIGNYKGILKNAWVVNNTCFYNNRGGRRDGDSVGTSSMVLPWAELVIDNMQDVKINGNIFYSRGTQKTMINSDGNALITGLDMNYNLWNNKNNTTGAGLVFQYRINGTLFNYTSYNTYIANNTFNFDKQSKYGNPLFTNEGIAGNNTVNPNLHIKTGSIAEGGGDPSALGGNAMGEWGSLDYYGTGRIVGTIDIGAHELATGTLMVKMDKGADRIYFHSYNK